MSSLIAERVIADATRQGKALLKFISPNDVGKTGSHQYGFYLPRSAWQFYSPYPPEKGKNSEHPVTIIWQDGRTTASCVKWYGKGTRSEYRLTRFGNDFPFLLPDNLGNLFVLIPKDNNMFHGYVIDGDTDVDDIQAALGIDLLDCWALYDASVSPALEPEEVCISRHFRDCYKTLADFPPTSWFSEQARRALIDCIPEFLKRNDDLQLMKYMEAEYILFRLVERLLCQNEITRRFKDLDDFLMTASRIMNRRKARAGRSLENHVEFILRKSGIPFDMRPDVDGKPDIIIPGKVQYEDPSYPLSNLVVVGVKTTCKDRWRQVLNEAKRIPRKYILTTQSGISANQLEEMYKSNVTLIVPQPLHKQYPKGTRIEILSIDNFLHSIKNKFL